MFDVDDDMDELFRRAADGYPLNTSGSDWQQFEKRLAEKDLEKQPDKGQKNKRSWLLLLLLIPFTWICNNYMHDNNKQVVQSKNVSNTKLISSAKPASNDVGTGVESAMEKSIKQQSEVLAKPQFKEQDNSLENLLTSNSRGSNVSSNPSTKKRESNNSTSIILPKEVSKSQQNEVAKNDPLTMDEKPGVEKQLETNVQKQSAGTDVNLKQEAKTYNAIDTSISNAPQAKSDVIKTKKKPSHFFYAGIVANADLSTIKLQSIRAVGTGGGILVGYQLTPKLSIESGVYRQKKFYYTDAKYFNPKTPYTAPSYKLLSVDGNCNMYELPINVKYNFRRNDRSAWFVLAGASSYIMKGENYDYDYESYGQLGKRYVQYTNSTKNWFSVLNIDLGYQHKLSKASAIRIEPYTKIPLKSLGYGRLSITSMGINIGYTKLLF